MRPLVVLLGIVMGSTVSIAAVLLLVGLVFLLMPDYSARLLEEKGPLLAACVVTIPLAAIAVASFYGELRARVWRFAAHAGLVLMLVVALWTYWPKP